ncbi:MAG TPA: SpoIIE family protein phosphatase [Streptosporangiaceae bacterium]|nr:SpoIIE family protein phosphatase [Streptosporangiaceae bacterium]
MTTSRDETTSGVSLTPGAVLRQIEAAVLVTDRFSNVMFANAYAGHLFGFPLDPGRLVGRSLLSLGLEEEDVDKVSELAKQVLLHGREWEGTLATARPDGSRVFVHAQAVPLRSQAGTLDGIVLIARQATRRSQRERDRVGLLDRIGERLARSLELDVTLAQVAQTLVPQFADHCFIDLLQGDKLVRRAQFHAYGWEPPAGTWAQAGQQIEYPAGHFCQQAMSRQEAILVENLENEHFPAPNASSLRASEDVGLSSIVAAPLVARGELLGVISLALSSLTQREEQEYDAGDRDFLGAVASRVAIAIDNAMLYQEERNTALAFQTSLLPQEKPRVDGLDVAWHYVPAKPLETHGQGIQTQVGGDWYDLIPLSAGRVGIVIGDVEGRGARAAAIMGQLRAALRAFAQDDKPPAEILRKLDDWCRTQADTGTDHPDEFDGPRASCTYLVYDAWSRSLTFANAGHDAPLLVTDGDVRELEIEHEGVLLGVRGKGMTGVPTFVEEARQLPPGCSLVLYTDGLTERRQREDGTVYDEDETKQILRSAVRKVAGADPETILQTAEDAVPGVIDDDMAIVVVRTSQEDLDSWEEVFPAEAIRVSEARRQAQAVFQRWGLSTSQVELACLLVSEVVTNVVLHTAAPSRSRARVALETAGVPAGTAASEPSPASLAALWETDDLDGDLQAPVARRSFTLRLRRGGMAVWAEVFDSDLRLPRIRTAGETDEGGRGLYLVDQLATRWGSRPTRDGKAVWFELPINEGTPGSTVG